MRRSLTIRRVCTGRDVRRRRCARGGRHALVALTLAAVAFAGCGGRSSTAGSQALGRAIEDSPPSVTTAPAPVGDPPAERGGSVTQSVEAEQSKVAAAAIAPSPRAALRRYALAYTNWRASELPAHERELIALAVGAARLAAEQTAASASAAASLATNHVENKGVVLTIAPGEGAAGGQWVIVTQEQTSGTGAYAGLPPAPHVTLARVTRVGQGWAVSEWRPKS